MSTLSGFFPGTGSPGTGTGSLSVVTANGLSGTVANASTSPEITLSTTVTGIVKGNGATLSAAVAADFPILNQDTTGNAATATTATNVPVANITGVLPVSKGGTGTTTGISGFSGTFLLSSRVTGAGYGGPYISNTTYYNTSGRPMMIVFTTTSNPAAGSWWINVPGISDMYGPALVYFASWVPVGGGWSISHGDPFYGPVFFTQYT